MSNLDTYLVERQDLPFPTDPELPPPLLDALPRHVGLLSKMASISESVDVRLFAFSFLFNTSA